jgi:hypothetical protein
LAILHTMWGAATKVHAGARPGRLLGTLKSRFHEYQAPLADELIG